MTAPNDIPIAQRVNTAHIERRSTFNPVARSLRSVPWWGYSLAVVAFFLPLIGSRFLLNSAEPNNTDIVVKAPISTETVVNPTITSTPNTGEQTVPENILGHLAYEEASQDSLRTVGRAYDGYEIKLRPSAAKSYQEMITAAKASGIDLVPISGFRTRAEQEKLFFEISRQRNQNPAERATVSAPPGYSEHHTGYVVDIGDASNPGTNLSPSFERTAAFMWLQQNAAQYSFELSFPPNNSQGVMYEPWHWRFVGDSDSLATFYKSHQLPKKSQIK